MPNPRSITPNPSTEPTIITLTEGGGEAKSEFHVYLNAVGPDKIGVIKEVRAVTGLGLADGTR